MNARSVNSGIRNVNIKIVRTGRIFKVRTKHRAVVAFGQQFRPHQSKLRKMQKYEKLEKIGEGMS